MTDIQSENSKPAPTPFGEGEQLTIRRGKGKGETGTVIGVNATDQGAEYAIKMPNGALHVVTHANVKPVPEPTIGANLLARMLFEWRETLPDFEPANDLIGKLDRIALPGFANKVSALDN